ncbi:MAG: GUN4 domain-containing protein [Cyanobacteria bacterium P01_E01_bin.35]
MKLTSKIIPLMIGVTVGGTVIGNLLLSETDFPAAIAAVQVAQALSPEEVNLRAKQIIVRIDGASVGSGSIIEYADDVYTVLTNWHVMKNQGEYMVRTIDGRKHQVLPASIKRLPGLDLAILQFTSVQNYQTAELGNSSNLTEGQNVYFAGYPGELRREDNRYYRFFTANLVGILPKSTENGYSLIYSGEAFPGMSGGPVFSKDGLMIGVHGEANIHALSGATSNYAIPINSYQEAIAKLNTPSNTSPAAVQSNPVTDAPESTPEVAESPAAPTPTPESTPEVAEQPEAEQQQSPPAENNTTTTPLADNSKQPQTSESLGSDNISSVPTFTSNSAAENSATKIEPEVIIEFGTEEVPTTADEAKPEDTQSQVDQVESTPNNSNRAAADARQQQPEVVIESEPAESEEIDIPTTSRRIALISPKTGIDYTKLRNLLRDKKWSEADIHTYQLIEQVVKSAKRQNKHVFIELKTIAEFACPDVRTADYLWKKYSNNKFGFSPQQKVWQSVNQQGDFSTQTWRRFATEVGWKTGEITSGSGYLLYEQLDFEPKQAPAGHLPWWFSLPDEEQKVIKYLFARCNLNPTAEELEAEAQRNSPDTAQNTPNNQPNINKAPK